MRPIIFLDFDGVLRPIAGGNSLGWSSKCIKLLNHLTQITAASIVISSAWRYNHSHSGLVQILRSQGVQGHILGSIPTSESQKADSLIIPGSTKGEEIAMWLSVHTVTNPPFVIFDDEASMRPFMHKLVLVNGQKGLEPMDVERAIQILNS